MNKLFLHYVQKYTSVPYELIVIDNNSTDGSREFFQENGAIVIHNKQNYSYPYCQNQGIEQAKYDVFVFLNNDLIVSPHWDTRLLRIMEEKQLDVFSLNTNDKFETPEITRKYQNRWKAVKNPLLYLFGQKKRNLQRMLRFMYGKWDVFTEKRFAEHQSKTFTGICGSAVIQTRRAIELIGQWDNRLQAADFDLYLRCAQRHENHNDIALPQVLQGIYAHHFMRLTIKQEYPPFADKDNIISVKEKWGKDQANHYLRQTGMVVS